MKQYCACAWVNLKIIQRRAARGSSRLRSAGRFLKMFALIAFDHHIGAQSLGGIERVGHGLNLSGIHNTELRK